MTAGCVFANAKARGALAQGATHSPGVQRLRRLGLNPEHVCEFVSPFPSGGIRASRQDSFFPLTPLTTLKCRLPCVVVHPHSDHPIPFQVGSSGNKKSSICGGWSSRSSPQRSSYKGAWPPTRSVLDQHLGVSRVERFRLLGLHLVAGPLGSPRNYTPAAAPAGSFPVVLVQGYLAAAPTTTSGVRHLASSVRVHWEHGEP